MEDGKSIREIAGIMKASKGKIQYLLKKSEIKNKSEHERKTKEIDQEN